MSVHQQRFRGLVLLVVIAMAMAACGGSSTGDTTGGGAEPTEESGGSDAPAESTDDDASITMLTVAVPGNLDPHLEPHAGPRLYWYLVFDRLTQLDQQLDVQPMLAQSWDFDDTATVLTMTLRDDVVFHDGTPFDADAVVANIERAKTLEGSTQAGVLEDVTGVEAISPTEVQFTLANPRPDLPGLLAGPAGAMISPTAIADSAADLANAPGNAGSGPYVVASFTPSEEVVFERADGTPWDSGAGKLAELTIRFVDDGRTRFSALRAGEADIIYVQPAIVSDIAEAAALGEEDGFEHVVTPTGVLSGWLFKPQVAPFDDALVRQGLVQAIDRRSIVDGLLQGTCEAADQLARAGFPGHIDGFDDPFPYDQEAARRALSEAGADGLELDIHVITGREQIPAAMKDQLSAVGVTAEVTPLASVEVFTAFATGEIGQWMFQVSPENDPSLTFSNWFLNPSRQGLVSEPISSLLVESLATTDPAEREAVLQEMSAQLASEAVMVPLCHVDSHYLIADDIVGFDEAPAASAQFLLDLRHVGRSS